MSDLNEFTNQEPLNTVHTAGFKDGVLTFKDVLLPVSVSKKKEIDKILKNYDPKSFRMFFSIKENLFSYVYDAIAFSFDLSNEAEIDPYMQAMDALEAEKANFLSVNRPLSCLKTYGVLDHSVRECFKEEIKTNGLEQVIYPFSGGPSIVKSALTDSSGKDLFFLDIMETEESKKQFKRLYLWAQTPIMFFQVDSDFNPKTAQAFVRQYEENLANKKEQKELKKQKKAKIL